MVLDLLFGRRRKKSELPEIPFGRYSDNNKPVSKVSRWTEADELYKAGEYLKSAEAFFDYLCDDSQQNVELERHEGRIDFRIFQGSKMVRGTYGEEGIHAEVRLAKMVQPNIAVRRRLLEMNFGLYYTRYAEKDGTIYMKFDSPLQTATPNKMYYGLRELAIKSDKQDDLLLSDFNALQPVDIDHILPVPEAEKEIKIDFLHRWIKNTLEYIETLDSEKYSGGISYLLLSLVFRIDFLILPEGKLLNELEKIASTYYSKDDSSFPDRNPQMIQKFRDCLQKDRQSVAEQLFRSRHTFSIVMPHNLKTIQDSIATSLANMVWYRDHNFPELANKVMEYGFAYSQYSYSLPRPLTDLFRLFMEVNYSEFFGALGFDQLYDEAKNEFDEEAIRERIDTITGFWKQKYTGLAMRTKRLRFDNPVNFNQSYLQEIVELNLD